MQSRKPHAAMREQKSASLEQKDVGSVFTVMFVNDVFVSKI